MSEDALLLERLHDDALSDDERSNLVKQIRMDGSLRHRLAEERILMRRLSVLLVDDDPVAVADRVLHLRESSRSSRLIKLVNAVRNRRRHSPHPSFWSWSMVGAAILTLGIGLWWRLYSHRQIATAGQAVAYLQRFDAGTQVFREGVSLALVRYMPLNSGDRLVIPDRPLGDVAEIRYADNALILANPGSALILQNESGSKSAHIDHGTVRCSIAMPQQDMAMRLRTGLAEVEIVNAECTLSEDHNSTRITTDRGQVRMTRRSDAASIIVKAGEYAVVKEGEDLEARPQAIMASKPDTTSPTTRFSPVFDRDFDRIPDGESTPNDLVRLQEAGGAITAIVSRPYEGGSGTWRPDVFIKLQSNKRDGNNALYRIPEDVEIRIRLKAERPGTWGMSQMPTNPRSPAENCYVAGLTIGQDWQEFTFHASDMRPDMSNSPSRSFEAGMEIQDIGIYGFGVGHLWVDRITIGIAASNSF